MPSFVDDLTSLAYPKTAIREAPTRSTSKYLRAVDWNEVCQAIVDCRTAILSLRTTTNDLPLSQLAEIATARILGRVTAGTGDVETLTGTQVTALLDTFTTSAKGLVPAASGGSETTEFLRKDGSWAVAGTAAITPVLTLSAVGSNNVHSVNLSTLGDIDWLWIGAMTAGTPPRATTSSTAMHAKKVSPAWLVQGLDLVYAGISVSALAQASSWRTITTTAADSCSSAAVGSLQGHGLATPGAGLGTGWGWRISIPAPADNISRTLRIYGSQFSTINTYSAYLTDGSTTVASVTTDSTASTQLDYYVEVTYKSRYGGNLVVNILTSTSHSSGANLRLMGMSLGTA
jgi:hypothetical protein